MSHAAPIVRLFELESPIAKEAAFMQAGKANITASVGNEAGVLAMLALREKQNSDKTMVFEIYRDDVAYQAHIKSTHFQQYLQSSADFIGAKKLTETVPMVLLEKPGAWQFDSEHPTFINIAHITVKSADRHVFFTTVRDEMQQTMAKEDGVLAMYAVTEKQHPNQWIFVEIYQSKSAYQQHRATRHFRTYLEQTTDMTADKTVQNIQGLFVQSKGGLSFIKENL